MHPTSIDSPAAPHTTNRKYLRQLDGIRAVAVLSVVLFHTKVPFFANGYIGVDVFFVLSGYLITGILLDEFDRTDRIAFGRFYLRRALRLLPALLFLALALVTAYALLLPPEERRESLLPVLAAVGYATSPLAASGMDLGSMLHAWSLSVESCPCLLSSPSPPSRTDSQSHGPTGPLNGSTTPPTLAPNNS